MKHEIARDINRIFADGKLIDRAIRKAVREAVLQHKHAGNPIAEWRDGKVVWIKPEDIGPDGRPLKRCPHRARKCQSR